MNAIKTIGLSASLVLATGLANAADYNLGDITSSSSNGFYTTNSLDPFMDTFTFSITEESQLVVNAVSGTEFNGYDFDGSYVVFSSVQLEEFEGSVINTREYGYYDEYGYYVHDEGDYYYYDYYDDDDYDYYHGYENYGYDDEYGYSYGGLASNVYLDVTFAAGSYSLQVERALDPSIEINGSEVYYFVISASSIAAPVPEPSSIALMLGGLGLVGFMAARRKRT